VHVHGLQIRVYSLNARNPHRGDVVAGSGEMYLHYAGARVRAADEHLSVVDSDERAINRIAEQPPGVILLPWLKAIHAATESLSFKFALREL